MAHQLAYFSALVFAVKKQQRLLRSFSALTNILFVIALSALQSIISSGLCYAILIKWDKIPLASTANTLHQSIYQI